VTFVRVGLRVLRMLVLMLSGVTLSIFTLLNLGNVMIVFWCGLSAVLCVVEAFVSAAKLFHEED
jgi:hypothetical protein